MKVLHVITGISPASGGPTRSVKGICRALDKAGINVTLDVLRGDHAFERCGNVHVVYGDKVSVRDYDLVHVHGLWNILLHRVVVECRRCSIPYIVSPRGMLDPWALSIKPLRKRLALLLYQKKDLENAAAFHVTASAEADHVKAMGLKQKCIVAPNGVDMPLAMPPRKVMDEGGGVGRKAIFLSRLHPGKGLLVLAEAWAKVAPQGWSMEVIGPDSYGHKAEVVSRLKSLGIADQWHFKDMVDDIAKWKCYRSSDLLIHPSVSENFGITIAEGLAAGLPVIATQGTPWRDLVAYGCGWWIGQGVEALADALTEATAISDMDRLRMGQCGTRLVLEKYTWDAVCRMMITGYESVL